MILVSAHRNDPAGRAVKTFSNSNQTHWVRETNPDLEKLSPLAQFLVENLRSTVGTRPHPAQLQAECFNGRTYCEQLAAQGNPNADAARKTYGDRPHSVNWLFDQIRHNEDDTAYWNKQAEKILAAGVVIVRVGKAEWHYDAELSVQLQTLARLKQSPGRPTQGTVLPASLKRREQRAAKKEKKI